MLYTHKLFISHHYVEGLEMKNCLYNIQQNNTFWPNARQKSVFNENFPENTFTYVPGESNLKNFQQFLDFLATVFGKVKV